MLTIYLLQNWVRAINFAAKVYLQDIKKKQTKYLT